MYRCFKCKCECMPCPSRIIKRYFICDKCSNEQAKAYRLRRKIQGNPVVSVKLPKEYFDNYQKQYYSIEEKRLHRNKKAIEYNKRPEAQEKIKCRRKTRTLVAKGEIIKTNCENCGTAERIQCHHNDYRNPFNINWLCLQCHKLLHKKKDLGEQ